MPAVTPSHWGRLEMHRSPHAAPAQGLVVDYGRPRVRNSSCDDLRRVHHSGFLISCNHVKELPHLSAGVVRLPGLAPGRLLEQGPGHTTVCRPEFQSTSGEGGPCGSCFWLGVSWPDCSAGPSSPRHQAQGALRKF